MARGPERARGPSRAGPRHPKRKTKHTTIKIPIKSSTVLTDIEAKDCYKSALLNFNLRHSTFFVMIYNSFTLMVNEAVFM